MTGMTEIKDSVLAFEGVNGKNRKFRLKNVNFRMEPGYIYCITGENGAGKTTLMRYIIDEYARYKGNIYFERTDIRGRHSELMEHIGVVSEDNVFFEDRTCIQNVNMLKMLYKNFDMDRFETIMKKMNMQEGMTYKKMSRGEKVKFQLAFAFSHGSRLYLMDEATAGMDPVFRIDFFDILRTLIRDEMCTVLMTTHNTDEIRKQTDYYAVMDNGQLGEFRESSSMGKA
ncbi:MAG: ABC transporter ATP-binding protein [Lachnospiraceae bacterium]|nr:ABC transporter ATP-binding protein [Lachnospiraceae bacterium]